MSHPPDLASLRKVLCSTFPDLEGLSFTLLDAGWDSVAVDAGGIFIFKFPRHENGRAALEREAALLAALRPHLSFPIPDLTLHEGPPLFSRHRKIPGSHLLRADYLLLPHAARERLAADLATFYMQLHAVDPGAMSKAGALPVPAWPGPEEMLRDLHPLLDSRLLAKAADAITRWQAMEPDPGGEVYGFFDGHGWNMAFDHERQVLNGIYDFADSGIGPLHREFIYTGFISGDLSRRVTKEYEILSGRSLDHERIWLLTGVLFLSDLAGTPDHPVYGEFLRACALRWLERED